ncbi:hypothetical protein ABZ682_22810 [Streptomyces griseoviridis]
MIYAMQVAAVGGPCRALRSRPADTAALGRPTALATLLVSLLLWDAW